MNQNQKSTRDHIVKNDDPTYKRQNQRIIKQLPEFASIQSQESISKLGCREFIKKKYLDEGLAQILVSFNAKLTNFFENGALSEFDRWRELRDFLARLIWLTKA